MTFVEQPSDLIKQGMIVDRIPWSIEGPKPLGIVLSNPCDLEHNKASYLLLAALISAKTTLQLTNEFQEKVKNNNEEHYLKRKSWKSLSEFIKDSIHNKYITRYYFIDPRPIIEDPPFFVDFQFVLSIPIVASNLLDKVAQLSSPFVEQMIMHFAAYTSRIACDRADDSQVERMVTEIAEPYTMSTENK
jgi:hypothetical protein